MVERGDLPSGRRAGRQPTDHDPDHDPDHDAVRHLLGREPSGRYDVVVRDRQANPLVIRNAPLLDDGTPMPTRYWLVGRDEVVAVSRLESGGGVRAAEAAVDPVELAEAHARYAAERDADLPADADPRPTGGVAGTRRGVKCLHAHYAWHLAGGDDPVGRWVADELVAPFHLEIASDRTVVRHDGWSSVLSLSSRALVDGELSAHDPPSPLSLTNVLGLVTDHLDDVMRARPEILESRRVVLSGDESWHLACVERGTNELNSAVTIGRGDLEDLFRTLATESRSQRLHNPALSADRVDLIVATCCTALAVLRRLTMAEALFKPVDAP